MTGRRTFISRRAVTAAVMLVAAATVAPVSDAAALDGRVIERGTFSGVIADGWTFGTALVDQQLSVIYVDGARGLRRTTFPCAVGAPYFGRAVAGCDGQTSIVDLGSRRQSPVPALQPADRVGIEVGDQWLDAATTDGAGVEHRLLLDWRTGERHELAYSDTTVYDLNRTPLAARSLVSGTTLLGRPDSRIALGYADGDLRLRAPRRTLTIRRRCPGDGCRDVQYAAGIVSWTEGFRKACAFVVRTRRLACWTPDARQQPLIGTPEGGDDFGVTHTRFGLVITAAASVGVGPGFDLDHDGHVDQHGAVSFYVSLRSLL